MRIKFALIFQTVLTIIVNMCRLHGLFNGKSSSGSNLIFVKSLPYLHTTELHSPPFIVSILFLIPSQSSVYFLNTSLFSSEESKINIYFHCFLRYVRLLPQSSDAKDLHYKYFHNHQLF